MFDEANLSEPGLESALRKRSPKRRSLRWLALAAVIIAASVAMVQTLSSRTPEKDRHIALRGSLSVAVTKQDLVGALMPASSADSLKFLALQNFESKVSYEAVRECVAAAGGNVPSRDLAPDLANYKNLVYFENPDSLRTNGFGVTKEIAEGATPVPTLNVPTSCASAGQSSVAPVQKVLSSVVDPWMTTIASLEDMPQVTAAWDSWRACMAQHGYTVEDVRGFGTIVDKAIAAAGSLAAAQQAEFSLANLDADCLQPVVTARAQVREPARAAALANSSDAWRDATTQFPQVLASLSDKYGIPVPDLGG